MTADQANETMLAGGHWHHILNAEMTQNSIPKKNTYQKQDKILSQIYNNYKTASQPTDLLEKVSSQKEFKTK